MRVCRWEALPYSCIRRTVSWWVILGSAGGMSCGYFKRKTSLNDLVVNQERTLRGMLAVKLLRCSWRQCFLFLVHAVSSKGTTTKIDKLLSEMPVLSKRLWQVLAWDQHDLGSLLDGFYPVSLSGFQTLGHKLILIHQRYFNTRLYDSLLPYGPCINWAFAQNRIQK